MTTTLLLATKNAGKIREFRALFWDLPKLIVKAADEVAGISDIAEDGRTFEENATKKAREIAQATGHLVLADDSGLEVEALGGRPGVYSARYAGRHGDDEGNNEKLLLELAGVPDEKRAARYRVVLAIADPRGPLGEEVHIETGVCEGTILRVRRGQNGFGYDPVFAPKGHEKTMAELSPEEKNEISHRAEASAKMRKFLGEYLAQRAGVVQDKPSAPKAAAAPAAGVEKSAADKPATAASVEKPAAAASAEKPAATKVDKQPASPGAEKATAAAEKAAASAAVEKPVVAAEREKPAPAERDKTAPGTKRGKPRVA